MEDLEPKLKKLSVRAASHELDDRVLSAKPERQFGASCVRRLVPLWAALAACIVVGSLGFAGGTAYESKRSAASLEARPPIRIELIYDSPTGINPFDFTSATADFPDEEWEVRVTSDVETST
jgi:hypothetical protein